MTSLYMKLTNLYEILLKIRRAVINSEKNWNFTLNEGGSFIGNHQFYCHIHDDYDQFKY